MRRGRGGGRHNNGGYGGRNNFTGYRGDGGRGGGGRGRNNYNHGHSHRRGDQHPGISFLWNVPTDQPRAKVTCMTFDSANNHLYVGMNNGTVKIYKHNPAMGDKKRFVPAEPPQVQYPDCPIKSLMCFNSNVFVAMVTDVREPGKSSLFCANSQQTIEVPGKIEDCVLCTRAAQAEGPSMWAVTTAGRVAVVDIKPGENNMPLMVPKAELNADRQAHAASIARAAEVFCSAVNTSVLITGDVCGTLAVWNIANGGGIQKFNEGMDKAVTGILEYKGTHFLVSYLNGTVDVFQFMAQPADGQAVCPAPLATYAPASAGFNTQPAGCLTIAVICGPANEQNREALDWLVVSRLDSDSLEVVQMDPQFKWGGELSQTNTCFAILPVDVTTEQGGEERLVVCAHGSIVKIFRWKF